MSNLITKIASDEIIDRAFIWVCQRREHYHFNADIWQLRRWWHEKKPLIQQQLLSGRFRFRELRSIRQEDRFVQFKIQNSKFKTLPKARSLLLVGRVSEA